jgi:hypothetical protein
MSSSSRKMLQAAAGNAGGGGFYPYTVDYSARFNENDNAYLTKTPASAGDQNTWTLSVWFKIGIPRTNDGICLWGAGSNSASTKTDRIFIRDPAGTDGWTLDFTSWATSNQISVRTSQVFRDPSAWYHLVVAVDTNQGTASNRVKMYLNGSQITDFISETYPSSGYNTATLGNVPQYIGRRRTNTGTTYVDYYDGYMSQYALIDGQQLTPSSFGENKNGVWVPKNISGLTFGTNGFLLDFSNSAALGTDVSGNGNNFTSSGLTSSDQMADTPTNNYPTLQAAFSTSATTYSNGNLEAQQDSGANKHTRATFGLPTTGKWYWEVQFIDARATDPPSTTFGIGVSDNDGIGDSGYSTGAVIATVPGSTTTYAYKDGAYTPADNITLSNAVVDGDWFGIAYDADTRKMWLWSERDNTWLASGDPANGTNPWKTLTALSASQTYFPIAMTQTNDSGRWSKFGVNFGQYAFVGSAPTDFLELKAANLPEPVIGPNSAENVTDYFNVVLYTGNGTAIGSGGNAITGVGFQPDMVWIKNRDAADSWMIFDDARGATKYISFNTSSAEATSTESLTSFDSDGFTLGNNVAVNTSGEDYVAYCLKKGSASEFDFRYINHTNGSNTSIDFSDVLSNAKMYVHREFDGADSWRTYHTGLAAFISSTPYLMYLDLTDAQTSISSRTISGTEGTTFQLDSAAGTQDGYVWAFGEQEGFSKFGSYTGNGSTDGPFIYTGFRPAFVMVKQTNTARDWELFDSERNAYNVSNKILEPNNSDAEITASTAIMDILSNGFKLRGTASAVNESGGSYIYMCFSENHFKYSNAR